MQPLDMKNVVARVLNQIADLQARTGALLTLPETWPAALGYEPWVGEVWLNLVSNALKYGGSPARVELGGALEGSHVRFWVRDNGQTLSEKERMLVFIPFTRLHQERAPGHGLGLATVQRIVSRLEGKVGVKPGPQQGNEFFFELPAASQPKVL